MFRFQHCPKRWYRKFPGSHQYDSQSHKNTRSPLRSISITLATLQGQNLNAPAHSPDPRRQQRIFGNLFLQRISVEFGTPALYISLRNYQTGTHQKT
jgi:hypothetical protein